MASLQELKPVLRAMGVFFYWISLILFPFACINTAYFKMFCVSAKFSYMIDQ
jgi:hypothetical protein